MKTELKWLLIGALLAHAAQIVQAQTTTQSAAQPMHSASSPQMHQHLDPTKMEAKVAKHLAVLKTKLRMTASQEVAWTTFAAAMKPQSRLQHARPDPIEMEKLTAPERMDKMRAHRTQRMAEMQAQMDKRGEATKTFYAVLNTDQKKVFDAEHSKMMRRWDDRKGMDHGSRYEAPGAPSKP